MNNWFIKKLQLKRFRKEWRKINDMNMTYAENIFPKELVSVGKGTYGPLNIISFGQENCYISIGSFCSLASGVTFLMGGEHSYARLSTYPFKNNIFHLRSDTRTKGNIVIGDDVWIGMQALILSGVTVGQGAVIAAGAVVASDIPPYAVAGGNPARIIKYRCSEERRTELLKCNYAELSDELIRKHLDDLYGNIEEARINWFPTKL